MSGRKAKHARQQARAGAPPRRAQSWWSSTLVWAAVAAVVVAGVIGGTLAARGSHSGVVSQAAATGGKPLTLSGTSPVTGRQVSLASFPGKPIVLNVWASWCTGCKAEAHDLAVFERTHPGAQVVGIDTQDNDSDAQVFYLRYGWEHPSIRDPRGSLAAALATQGLPTTLFLDSKHRVVTRIVGAASLTGFDQGFRIARSHV